MQRSTSAQGWRLLALGVPFFSAVSFAAQTPTFTVQPLGNIPGGVAAYVYGVNDADEAVGLVGLGTSVCPDYCAAIWHDGTPTVLKTQANVGSGAFSINNAGQVAGFTYPNFSDLYTAVVWNNGTPTLLPAPASQYEYSFAYAINDAGQVAGYVFGSAGVPYEAAVWNGLTPMVLGVVPGCTYGSALGINGNGLVVGYLGCGKDGAAEAAVWKGTTAELLPIPRPTDGGVGGKAFAVNDSGLIVGSSISAGNPFNATAWANGVATDLGPFPTKQGSSSATAVNKQGIIVGKSTWVFDEVTHAALWSPIGAAPQDLNSLISTAAAAELTLTEATGISNNCTIVANGYSNKTLAPEAFLLKLIDPSSCVKGLVVQKTEN
jgi:probable HAF family extracellular repeat protein